MNYLPNGLISNSLYDKNIQFTDLFNISDIQKLQNLFSDVHHVASLITKPDGTAITNPSNFCRLCNDLVRKNKIGIKNCIKSDIQIGKYNALKPTVQLCLSVGLWDAGASITVDGIHIANWLIGQIRNEENNLDQMLIHAEKLGIDKEEYLAALNEVPIMSIEQFQKISDLLFLVANMLSENAYYNYQLQIQISERKKEALQLQKSEELYRSIIVASPDNITLTDLNGNVQMVSPSAVRMFKFESENQIIGKNILDFISVKNITKAKFSLVKLALGELNGSGEYQTLRADGSCFYCEVNGEYIHDANNNAIGIVLIIRDITEKKINEMEIKNRLKDLQRFHNLSVDREIKMIELKKEVNELLEKNGEKAKYIII